MSIPPTQAVYKRKFKRAEPSKTSEPTPKQPKTTQPSTTSTQISPPPSPLQEYADPSEVQLVIQAVQDVIGEDVGEEDTESDWDVEESGEEGEEGEEEEEEKEEAHDTSRFVSRIAEKNFEEVWSKKSVIVERGMTTAHFASDEFLIKQNFERRGWLKWAQFSSSAVIPIVQEFYANIQGIKHEEEDCLITRVRGLDLKIRPKDVRRFFGLREERDPEYPYAEGTALDRDALAQILTGRPHEQWGHKTQMAKNRLSPKFNALHFLTCSQLQPIQNTSELRYEKGLLLYAIDSGARMDLGKLIFDGMAALYKGKKSLMSLPFAGFITQYLSKHGIEAGAGERIVKPVGPISAASRERSASHKKGKAAEATTSEFNDQMLLKWGRIDSQLGELTADVADFKRKLKVLHKKMGAIAAEQKRQGRMLEELLAAFRSQPPPS